MKILLLGSGAREHALARSLTADPSVDELLAAPGNPGIAQVATLVPLDGRAEDPEAVLAAARAHGVDLVVVGPEAPLVAGVADGLVAAGIPCFGPVAAAARLEGSKAFAKEVMAAADVPTAVARVCSTQDEVAAALDELGAPHVVKDDGLAAGKGVVVTTDRDEALAHARACLARPDGRVVVEEFLDGPEVSLFCLCDGTSVVPLQPAQDFKRVGDEDAGQRHVAGVLHRQRVAHQVADAHVARRGFLGEAHGGRALHRDRHRAVRRRTHRGFVLGVLALLTLHRRYRRLRYRGEGGTEPLAVTLGLAAALAMTSAAAFARRQTSTTDSAATAIGKG